MCRAQGEAVAGRRWRLPGTLLLLLAYVGYLLLGSAAFWALEGPASRQSAQQLLQDKWELLGNYTCLKGPALERLIQVGGWGLPPGRRGQRVWRAPPKGRWLCALPPEGASSHSAWVGTWSLRSRGQLGEMLSEWFPFPGGAPAGAVPMHGWHPPCTAGTLSA